MPFQATFAIFNFLCQEVIWGDFFRLGVGEIRGGLGFRVQGYPRKFFELPKKEFKKKQSFGGNITAAQEIGSIIAKIASDSGVIDVVFDRGAYLYHGRVKALAEAARGNGLKF